MPPEPELTLAQLYQIPHQWLPVGARSPDNTFKVIICPECELATPTAELEQWSMCRFCAQKILWRRLV